MNYSSFLKPTFVSTGVERELRAYLMALLQKGAPQLGSLLPSFARARGPKRALVRRRIVAERMAIVVLVLVLLLIVQY
jgi:hypothetical protein